MSSPFRSLLQKPGTPTRYPTEQQQSRQARRVEGSGYRGVRNFSDKQVFDMVMQFNPRLYVSKGISEEDVIMIKKVFDEIDSTSKGILTPSDIKFSLQNCGFNANKETVYDIVAEYDEKEAGGIGFPEFMSIMMRRPGDQQSKQDVRKVFRKYDRKNKGIQCYKVGYINAEDIKNVLKEVQQQLTNEQLERILASAKDKNEGRLTLDDFYRLMTKGVFFQ